MMTMALLYIGGMVLGTALSIKFKKNPDVEEACWSTLYGIISIVAFAALLHFGGKCS